MLYNTDTTLTHLTHIHSYTHTLTPIHSYTHTLIHPYTHTLIHSYTPTLLHSYTHTLIHSYQSVKLIIRANMVPSVFEMLTVFLEYYTVVRQPLDYPSININ